MHHGADSDGTDRCKLPSVLLPYIPGQIPVAGLEAGHDILHRVGPDIIYQAVLPLMAPLCNRGRRLIGQYSLILVEPNSIPSAVLPSVILSITCSVLIFIILL